MRAFAPFVLAGLAAAAVTADAQNRQVDDSFTWSGRVAGGGTVRISNLAGRITVRRSTSGQVEVSGRKEWMRGDPADVRLEVVPGTNVVSICAVWYEGECTERGVTSTSNNDRSNRNRSNDVSVTFIVSLPAGVNLAASGVSADVDVTGVSGDIDVTSVSGDVLLADVAGDVAANSVSGDVEVRGTAVGAVRAVSVSGDVTVAVTELTGSGELFFETVSGDVEATLPATLAANLDMSTVSGELNSEFAMTTPAGRQNRRSLRAQIGAGGRALRVSTVSGDVTLRQR